MAHITATGYVHQILDKKLTFEQAIWVFARGMGALVLMRDEPSDAPIPERFEPNDYHTKRIAEAEGRLAALSAMDEKAARAEGERLKAENVATYTTMIADRDTEVDRVQELIAEVDAWQPPSKDHVGFKEFMLEQLRSSTRHEKDGWLEGELATARKKPARAYFGDAIDRAGRDIVYHKQEHGAEVERTEARNTWLKQLRESLSASKV